MLLKMAWFHSFLWLCTTRDGYFKRWVVVWQSSEPSYYQIPLSPSAHLAHISASVRRWPLYLWDWVLAMDVREMVDVLFRLTYKSSHPPSAIFFPVLGAECISSRVLDRGLEVKGTWASKSGCWGLSAGPMVDSLLCPPSGPASELLRAPVQNENVGTLFKHQDKTFPLLPWSFSLSQDF